MNMTSANNNNFEEQYLDVLHSIEFAIVSIYKRNHNLIDKEIINALDVLIREYQNILDGFSIKLLLPNLPPLVQQVYEAVKGACMIQLNDREQELSTQELIACLKRIRSSCTFWNKSGGRQGYLTFICNYVV
jgi:hypothetical protein